MCSASWTKQLTGVFIPASSSCMLIPMTNPSRRLAASLETQPSAQPSNDTDNQRMFRASELASAAADPRHQLAPLIVYWTRHSGLTRVQLRKANCSLYTRLRRRGLLECVPLSSRVIPDPLLYYKAHYNGLSRGQLRLADQTLYRRLSRDGLLDHLPRKHRKHRCLGNPLVYYRSHYPGVTRQALRLLDHSLYTTLRNRELLSQLPVDSQTEPTTS